MSLLAPLYAWLGVLAAALTVALHLLARRQPRAQNLPTARFVPEATASAAARARRPSDLAVLAARTLALLCVGLAAARPSSAPARRPVARVVVVTDTARAALDSAAGRLDAGDLLVRPAADGVPADAGDTITFAALPGTGPLSAALVAARRAASALRRRADSLELVIVAPFTAALVDDATDSLRALWPGRARLVPLAAAPPSAPDRIEVSGGGPADPLVAAAALLGRGPGPRARLTRRPAAAADSAFAAGGGVLIVWPAEPAAVFRARAAVDTIGALSAPGTAGGTLVAPFVRGADPPPGRAVLWWADGAPAATSLRHGDGCIRSVAVALRSAGDLALRSSLRAVLRSLAAPCLERPAPALDSAALARLGGPPSLMPADLAPRRSRSAGLPAALFLVAALGALALEWVLRRRPVPA